MKFIKRILLFIALVAMMSAGVHLFLYLLDRAIAIESRMMLEQDHDAMAMARQVLPR